MATRKRKTTRKVKVDVDNWITVAEHNRLKEIEAKLANLRAKIEDYDPRDPWERAADNHAAYDHDKLFPHKTTYSGKVLPQLPLPEYKD